MKRLLLLTLLLLATHCAQGQEDEMTLDDAMKSAEQWANENLDDDSLRMLRSADQQKVKDFFKLLEKQFHGEYVVDLAALKDMARSVLPLLEAGDETAPYAAWLRAQMDYLDVADQFRLVIPPPPTVPGQPPRPIPNPTPEKEREAWIKQLRERVAPKSAQPYLARLKAIFAEERVPPELVWVAEVESSFDPRARSPAGAAGMFQLMPDTAERYGLRVRPLDQRFKPEESARAAARYLRYLHGHFKDWRLALAAYNAGEGTVERELARHKTRTFDAIATHLPAETQMYVPRVEAVVLKREGIGLERL